jgi:hypothetical protein
MEKDPLRKDIPKMAKWEYRVSCVDDFPKQVDQNMAKWVAAGWELVSGGVASFTEAGIIHIRFVQYWRREAQE